MLLFVALCNQPCLESFDRPIRILLTLNRIRMWTESYVKLENNALHSLTMVRFHHGSRTGLEPQVSASMEKAWSGFNKCRGLKKPGLDRVYMGWPLRAGPDKEEGCISVTCVRRVRQGRDEKGLAELMRGRVHVKWDHRRWNEQGWVSKGLTSAEERVTMNELVGWTGSKLANGRPGQRTNGRWC